MPTVERIRHDSSRYRALYENAEVRTVFADPRFLGAIEETLDLDSATYTSRSEGEAALTVWYRRLGPFRRFTHPAVCYYSAAVMRGTTSGDVDALASVIAKSGAIRVQMPPAPRADLVRAAWSARPFATYRMATDELDPGNWSASRRRLFSKHQDVLQVTSCDARDVARWSAKAYARHDRGAPFRENRLVKLIEMLRKEGLVETLAVRSEGRSVGAVAVLVDDLRGYYWLSGSEPGAAMTVLLGSVFDDLRARGLGFDFLGANTPSIAEFKRRFGGQLVTHHHLHPMRGEITGIVKRIFARR
jgi:hypothetical protein